MGEAMFYLIANYESAEKAKEAEAKANTVLKDLADFEDDWQTIRFNQHKPVKEKHEELLRRHLLVSEFIPLPKAKENDSTMNYLAGNCEMEEDYSLTRIGATIMLSLASCRLGQYSHFLLSTRSKASAVESDE